MENEYQFPRDASQVEAAYFELQAYAGTTKHMGGLETTNELPQESRFQSLHEEETASAQGRFRVHGILSLCRKEMSRET